LPVNVFMKKHQLTFEAVPNYTTITVFLKGAVDATAAMWYNEYHTILNSGLDPDELTVFRLADLGADFPEDGLYCMEDTYLEDPKAAEAFVAASLRGWRYAFEHRDEALDIVMKYCAEAHTGTNRAHQRWMLSRMKDLLMPEGEKNVPGKLAEEDYLRIGRVLQNEQLVERLPDFADFSRGAR
jgi:NitT/TauT family transport system substrate-binding protein